MKVYINFIITVFLKSFIFVSLIVLSLVIVLNILTEIEFFREINVKFHTPIYLSFLNSPSLIFEMFPFVFLVCTQIFFINLLNNNQIQIFKYSGLRNSKIIAIISLFTFFIGILIITIFYNLSSNLKNVYLEIKNKYTSDDKYLAVITNNGLWIKDTVEGKTNIIHATKMDGNILIDTTITQLNKQYDVAKHIQSEKINITNKNWLAHNVIIFEGNEGIKKEIFEIYSNFDYKRIQGLFSNLSSLSLIELFNLRKNYLTLNYSTTEVNIQINKIISYPVYLSLMTILSAIIMFNTKSLKSITVKISIGLFMSVIIYYLNNFFHVMGKTEKFSIFFAVWVPILFLIFINTILTFRINEK
jgi:lipopolysaccharide export system permease protein